MAFIYNPDGNVYKPRFSAKKIAREAIAKGALDDIDKSKSVSSIYEKIYHQFNEFENSLYEKLPIRYLLDENKQIIFYIDNIKKLPVSKGNKALVLQPFEIANGVEISTVRPDLVRLDNCRHNVDSDAGQRCRYKRAYDENGDGLYQYNGVAARESPLYEINPTFTGIVTYKSITPSKVKYINILRKDKESSKYIKEKIDATTLPMDTLKYSYGSETKLKLIPFIKIKDYKQSAELFGYTKLKKSMMESDKLFQVSDILVDSVCKIDGKIRDIVEVVYNSRSYKFLGEELEFVYPDLTLLTKGYTLPMDRTLREGSEAIISNNKHTKLPLKAKVKVLKNTFKNYFEVEHDNKKYIVLKKQLKVTYNGNNIKKTPKKESSKDFSVFYEAIRGF